MIERGQGRRIRKDKNYSGAQNGPLIINHRIHESTVYWLTMLVTLLWGIYSSDGQYQTLKIITIRES